MYIQFIHVKLCSISSLLKVLLLTSEGDTNEFHGYKFKKIFYKS